MTKKWLIELDEENEELFLELAIAKNEVWNKISQDITSNGPN